MATKTLRVFAEYTSTGFVAMPTLGNIDYGFTLGSTFPSTTPTTYQTDNPDLVVTVTAMTDFYVWIRVNGQAWNPSYTRNVRVYPDSPDINSVVMNMIIATGPAGVGAYTQLVQTSNRLYFNGATTDATYNSKFAGKTYINELNFGTAPGLATVATTGVYADLISKPTLATVATSGLFTDLSSKPSGTAPLSYNSGTNSFVISQATTIANGYVSSTDWNTFNAKQTALGFTPYNATNPSAYIALMGLSFVAGSGGYNNTTGVITIPTNNTQITNGANYIALTGLSSTALGLTYANTTGVFSLTSGYVIPTNASATTWDNAYSNRIASLTTTGASGSASLVSNVLNIPTYTLSGLGGQPLLANLTSLGALAYVSPSFVKMTATGTFALDTSVYYLASNPNSYTANLGTVTSVSALTLGTSGTDVSSSVATSTTTAIITLNIPTASGANRGALSSADWTTFNNKSSTTGTVTSVAMSVPLGLSVSGSPITSSGTFGVTLTAGYVIPSTTSTSQWDSAYTNRITSLTNTGTSGSATLASNVLNIPTYTLSGLGGQVALSGSGFVKISGTTISYDSVSYLPLTGSTMSGSIGFSDSALTKRGMYGTMGGNDYWFIGASATATNSGYIEIATGDDGTEPIYIRQYSGDPYTTGTVARTATILDESGNSIFPNTLTATTLVKSGGTSTQYLMANGSVSTLSNFVSSVGTINELSYWSSATTVASLGVATYPSLTEISYVKGVTSPLQPQLNAKQATISLTTTGSSGAATFLSNVLNIPNYGSALSGYLPLSGGTLTGALSGTSATFSSFVDGLGLRANGSSGFGSTGVGVEIGWSGTLGYVQSYNRSTSTYQPIKVDGSTVSLQISGVEKLGIATTGAATFSSSVTAGERFMTNFSGAGLASSYFINTSTTGFGLYLQGGVSGNYALSVNNYLGTNLFKVDGGGAATFSSSVTALSLDVISSSGAGTSTASGLARFITAAATTAISVGQLNVARRLDIGSYFINVTGEQFELSTSSAQPIIFNTNATERMRITSGGNILMGTTTDNGEKLYVSGAIRATGNITANSDLTLKKNLTIIDNPIDKLMQLNGYAYQWKANDEYQYGVIAQEVEKVLPYAVQTGNDKIKGVAYNQLTPLLIEGFKSHESEITILKARVKYLESKLA